MYSRQYFLRTSLTFFFGSMDDRTSYSLCLLSQVVEFWGQEVLTDFFDYMNTIDYKGNQNAETYKNRGQPVILFSDRIWLTGCYQQIFANLHNNFQLSHAMLPYIFIGLAIVFFAIYFATKKPETYNKTQSKQNLQTVEVKSKINYGKMRIFYGSQTGTAAKLSEQIAEEGAEEGFQAEVIDLKDVKIQHFESSNQIAVFLLSNTGEGDPPQNGVRFMKILKGKQSIHQVKELDWSKLNYSVFGLGNTQYEHYNVTGINADSLLQKLGAKRIFKLGLGDDNCSLEDDCNAWRKQLWPALKKFRQQNPVKQASSEHESARIISEELHNGETYISKIEPIYANYKIFVSSNEDAVNKEWDYDFKTKASLKAEKANVHNIRQLRQNQFDGSTLQFEVQLPASPEYQTAGNIALYSKNDPQLLREVIEYFGVKESDLDKKIGLKIINEEKKQKLNFVPNTLRNLLEQSIDLQGKITKSFLKKLAKFESTSQNYFTQNSSPKTTDEYRRITERTDQGQWYYPIKVIKQHHVVLSLEDFIELSDSMAPRLFTIASHAKTQKNPIVAASLVANGLISKFFLQQPNSMRAELRKSTFTDAMKWKKVIFVAAGTGLAPFRAYLQEKIFNIKQKSEGKETNVPIISLFFGCKHENGDFIYKDEILAWRNQGIIERLHLAFSRDTATERKVYVQHLLERQQAELNELGHCNQTAIYICGSLPMGNTIVEILTKRFGAEAVKKMEEERRIVKELW